MSFTSIETGTGSDTLTTKRSCTPLATVSDSESDDGSSSRDETSGDTARRSSASQDKAESVVRYVASTVNYVIRQQRSPRTAISLDNVDLWEEEEDSDVDDRNSPGFDRINGVPINPRSTIDFSELRRSRSPVASKRNRYKDDPDGWTTSQKTNMAELKADMISAKKSLLEARNKSRLQRAQRKLPKATTLSTDPPTGAEARTTSEPNRLDHVDKDDSRSSKQCAKLQMPPLSSTYTFTDSNPALILTANNPSTNHCVMSKVKMKELYRVNGKMAGSRSIKTSSKHQPISGQASSKQQPISGRDMAVKDDLKRVRDLDNGGSTDSNMSSGSTGNSPERKVKFNSFVTVRQGEVNTYGYLRESRNSAQVIKQKYLAIGGNKRSGTS